MHNFFVIGRQLQLTPIALNLEYIALNLLLKHGLDAEGLPLVLLQRLAAFGLLKKCQEDIITVTRHIATTTRTCSRSCEGQPG